VQHQDVNSNDDDTRMEAAAA